MGRASYGFNRPVSRYPNLPVRWHFTVSCIMRSWALVRFILVSLCFMVGVVLTGAVSLLVGQESTQLYPLMGVDRWLNRCYPQSKAWL